MPVNREWLCLPLEESADTLSIGKQEAVLLFSKTVFFNIFWTTALFFSFEKKNTWHTAKKKKDDDKQAINKIISWWWNAIFWLVSWGKNWIRRQCVAVQCLKNTALKGQRKKWMSNGWGWGSPSKVKWEVVRQDDGFNHWSVFYSGYAAGADLCIMIKKRKNDGMWVIQKRLNLWHMNEVKNCRNLQSMKWASGVRPAQPPVTPQAQELTSGHWRWQQSHIYFSLTGLSKPFSLWQDLQQKEETKCEQCNLSSVTLPQRYYYGGQHAQFQTIGHQWEILQHGPSLGGTSGGTWSWQLPNFCTHFHLSPKRGGDGAPPAGRNLSVFAVSECVWPTDVWTTDGKCCGDPMGPIILCNLSACSVAVPHPTRWVKASHMWPRHKWCWILLKMYKSFPEHTRLCSLQDFTV